MKVFNTLADLQGTPLKADSKQLVQTKGKLSIGDGLGETYYITTGTPDNESSFGLVNGNIAVIYTVGNKGFSKTLTLAEAVSSKLVREGDTVVISDRGNGLFEYKTGQVANTFNIVACTGVPTLSLVLVLQDSMCATTFGVKMGGIVDNAEAINHALTQVTWLTFPAGICRVSSVITLSGLNKLVGSGATGEGTIFWKDTIGDPCIKVTRGENVLRDFLVISAAGAIQYFQAQWSRTTNVKVGLGNVGYGFLIDGTFSSTWDNCAASTNGSSLPADTTEYTGRIPTGFRVRQGAGFARSSSNTFKGCYVAGCEDGVIFDDTDSKWYGGTIEGNDRNITVQNNANYSAFKDVHVETAGEYNVLITDSDGVLLDNCGCYSADLVTVKNARRTVLRGGAYGNLDIQSSAIDTTLEDSITEFPLQFIDNGVGTTRVNTATEQNENLRTGGVANIGTINLVDDGLFSRWKDTATPLVNLSKEAAPTVQQYASLKYSGDYSCRVENTAGNPYCGLQLNDIGGKVEDEYITISYKMYVPTGNSDGSYGVRVYGLATTEIVFFSIATDETNKWIKKSITVYVGKPQSTRRTGNIDVRFIVGHNTAGSVAYFDSVSVVSGRATSTEFISNEQDQILLNSLKINKSASKPLDSMGLQGDFTHNSVPTVTASNNVLLGWVHDGVNWQNCYASILDI